MKKTVMAIACLAFQAVFLPLLLTACSSDDAPVDEPKIEFRTTAKDLNAHLREYHDFPDVPSWAMYVTAHDEPDVEILLLHGHDVFDIPASGGAYDFVPLGNYTLKSVEIYEDIPHLSHDRDNYFLTQDEVFTYRRLIELRDGADHVADFTRLLAGDPVVGTLSYGDSQDGSGFTYSFPRNMTGKYRLINFICGYADTDYVRIYDFIQMPD